MNPIATVESSVSNSDWATFSDCSDNSVPKRFYGGFGIYGKTVSIKKTFDIVDENGDPILHSSVLVRFYYLQAENYETLPDQKTLEEVDIKVNGDIKQRIIQGGTEMGCGRLDQGENYGWIEANSTSTNSTFTVSLDIVNNFQDPAWFEGLGLREMVIIVERCVKNCVECGDYDGCVTCDTGYYLWRAQCYKDKCPDGSFYDTTITTKKVCSDCNPTCLTCKGPNQNQCLTCQDPRLFKSSECLLDCGQGFYPTKPNCSPCHSECYYCDGPTNKDCKRCTGNRYFYKLTKQCLLKCPDTFFENSSTNTCDPCNSKCLTCNGPSENQCLTCPPPNAFFYSNKCDSACPFGMYGDKSDQICKLCKSPCQTCKDTPTKCTSCVLGLFLDGQLCNPTCPNRFYGNLVSQVCEKCHTQCAQCKGATQFDCLSCDEDDGFLDTTKNQCVNQCPIKYYASMDSGEPLCKPCFSTCTECKPPGGQYSCTRCSGSRYLTENKSCDEECPPYFYKDTSNNVCKKCHVSCLTCINDSSTGCLSCIQNRYLNEHMCLDRCPDKTFADKVKGVCFPCYPSCASCDGDLYNNCTSCQLGKYLQDRTCSEKCKDGYYPDISTLKCLPCHSTCSKCMDGNQNSCLTCQTDLYLSNNKCLSNCPEGHFQNNSTLMCEACPFTCKTCTGLNNDTCLSCGGNRYLVKPGMKCESYCPQGFFANNKTNECDMCSLKCKNCFGSQDDQCKECSSGQYLLENKCVQFCPFGYFPTEQPNICNPCHFSCTTCNGSLENQCTSCSGERYYLPHSCMQSCPDKYFGNQKTNNCDKCDKTCRTCFGENYNNCLSCNDDKLLLNHTCVDECPVGYVRSLDNSECLLCGSNCQTCSPSNVDICLTCKEGWYMHSNKCYQICPQGTYAGSKIEIKTDGTTIETKICKNCVENCIICNGQSEQECQKWVDNQEQRSEKIIFWIFIGKTLFCVFNFLFGFYLDYKAYQKPQTQSVQVQNDEVESPDPISPAFKNNSRSYFDSDRMQHPLRGSKRNPSFIPLQVQPQGNTPHNGSGIFDGYNPNITSQKNGQENDNTQTTKSGFVRSQKRGFSLIRQAIMTSKMLQVNGDIKKRSDQEIKDFIAPLGGSADFQMQTYDAISNDSPTVKNSTFVRSPFRHLSNKITEGNNSTVNLYRTSSNTGLKLSRMGTLQNLNTTTLNNLKGHYDPITNTFTQIPCDYTKKQLPDKSFFTFLITFFEPSSILLNYNKDFIRPLRALIYYCKLLFLFWITSRYLSLINFIVFAILVGLQVFMVSVDRLVGFLAGTVQKAVAIIFAIFTLLALYNVIWFFVPEIQSINYQDDHDWSMLYLMTFGGDLVIIQLIFLCIQYWYTKTNIFKDLKKDKITKILSFFLFKRKFAEWMKKN